MHQQRNAIPRDREVSYEGVCTDVSNPGGAEHAQQSDPARILLADPLVEDRGDFRRVLHKSRLSR